MPVIIYNKREILAEGEGIINKSGNIYIEGGRKHIGTKVRWVILKEQGSD